MNNEAGILVSVIVPVYNAEKYLNRCLESLINQTLKNIEIICINDGSTDNSLQIIKDYSNKDNRIVVIDQQNQGVSASRNQGMKIAKGEYLAFCDADDWLDLEFYEKLYRETENGTIDVVKGNTAIAYDSKIEKKGELNALIKTSGYMLVTTFQYEWWSAIYKKSMFEDGMIKFHDARLAEDQLFLCQTLCRVKTFRIVDDVFYYYFQNH